MFSFVVCHISLFGKKNNFVFIMRQNFKCYQLPNITNRLYQKPSTIFDHSPLIWRRNIKAQSTKDLHEILQQVCNIDGRADLIRWHFIMDFHTLKFNPLIIGGIYHKSGRCLLLHLCSRKAGVWLSKLKASKVKCHF